MLFDCSFTILSDTKYLTPLRGWVEAVARIVGRDRFPKGAIISCSLALVEAVNNAIFHAHGRRKEIPIKISIRIQEQKVIIEVVDGGTGIGRQKKISPDSMVTHGRGVFLIKEVMNSVSSKVSDGKHHMRMVYNI